MILARYAWWAPIVLAGAWLATHWLLRESAIWRDRNTDEVRGAQRDADYAYRLAVDPPASKELRLFGLAGWTIDRFIARRTRLHELQYAATRLRERPVIWSMLLVVSANVVVFWLLASAAADGRISLGEAVVYVQSAIGVSMIAFGGFSWALDGAAAPVAAVLRLEPAMRPAGELRSGNRPADATPAREIRLRDVTFAYPASARRARAGAFRSHDSRRLVARHRGTERRRQDDASPSCCAGCTIRSRARSRSTASTFASSISRRGARASRPCSRTSSASSCRCATTWRRQARRTMSCAPRSSRRERRTWPRLDTVLARGYDGGTDLSGGQWQRIALARALAAVKLGAGVVLLDEPTAQLDVRGEAEIFDRLLAATRHCTTILISHRFSTVRHADRICVLEHGRVIELGTHDELMALGGRYRTMFDLQAQRFNVPERGGHDV